MITDEVQKTENQRAACHISINLSNTLITSALGMLAILGATFTFMIENREVSCLFYVLLVGSVLSFISSIFLAGKAITEIRDNGFKGNWSIENGSAKFNRQALLCIFGILFFIAAVLLTPSKESKNTTLNKNEIILRLEKLEKILRKNSPK